MRWAVNVARMGERKKNANSMLVGKPERKGPLERLTLRWVDNIKMDLREIRFDCMAWIYLARVRDLVEGSCERGNELSGSIKCYTLCNIP
jgi:hypothetical protein